MFIEESSRFFNSNQLRKKLLNTSTGMMLELDVEPIEKYRVKWMSNSHVYLYCISNASYEEAFQVYNALKTKWVGNDEVISFNV